MKSGGGSTMYAAELWGKFFFLQINSYKCIMHTNRLKSDLLYWILLLLANNFYFFEIFLTISSGIKRSQRTFEYTTTDIQIIFYWESFIKNWQSLTWGGGEWWSVAKAMIFTVCNWVSFGSEMTRVVVVHELVTECHNARVHAKARTCHAV